MVTLLCCNVKFSTRFLYFVKEEPCLTDKPAPRPFLGGAAMILYNFVNMKYHAPIFLFTWCYSDLVNLLQSEMLFAFVNLCKSLSRDALCIRYICKCLSYSPLINRCFTCGHEIRQSSSFSWMELNIFFGVVVRHRYKIREEMVSSLDLDNVDT